MDLADRLREALVDRYAVEGELGRGGMAVVFLARDLRYDRRVAIKVLRPELTVSLVADRFLREIQIAAQLQHPLIVPLYDSGGTDDLLWYVMPFIDGDTLRKRLQREKQLPLEDALQITRDAAAALQCAHEHGFVHRDIKPENILLSGGRAVIADFGIARALTRAAGQGTSSGVAIGTPAYMSPEQGSGSPNIDARTDIYSLGCVLYEMLAGEPPFTGPTPQAVIARHVSERPPSLRVIRPQMPEAIETALERALAKVPADRPTTATEFAHALAAGVDAQAKLWRRPWVSRRGRLAVVSLAVVVVLIALGRAVVGAPKLLNARDWILVADFDGPADDPGLAAGLRELVTAELNQSRYFSTYPRSRLGETMRLAGVPDTAHVNAELGRQLAVRGGIRAVLLGSISRLGDQGYSIVLHVIGAEDGDDLLSIAGASTDETLVADAQKLGHQLRQSLGERRQGIESERPLRQVATPSFAAYRKYVEAGELQLKGELASSNRLLREALALDSNFASAWAMLGMNYRNARQLDSAQVAFQQALARPGRLTDPLRYRAEADVAYTLRYDLPAAIRAYDLMLEADPGSAAGLNNRALLVGALGRYEEALLGFRAAAAVNPFAPQQAQIELTNEVATLVALGRMDEARRVARDLSGHFAKYGDMLFAVATDEWAFADSAATSVISDVTSPAWLRIQAVATLASARAARGMVASADSVLAANAEASGSAARWYHEARLLLYAASGHPLAHPSSRLMRDTTAAGELHRGLWFAVLGDAAAARRELARMERRSDREKAILDHGMVLVRAWVAAQVADWPGVVRLLGAIARRGEHDSSLLDRVGSLSLRWLVADAYARLGRADSSITYLELAVSPYGMPGSQVALRGIVAPFARYRLARMYQELGKGEEARRHWNALRRSFTQPDERYSYIVREMNRALGVEHP